MKNLKFLQIKRKNKRIRRKNGSFISEKEAKGRIWVRKPTDYWGIHVVRPSEQGNKPKSQQTGVPLPHHLEADISPARSHRTQGRREPGRGRLLLRKRGGSKPESSSAPHGRTRKGSLDRRNHRTKNPTLHNYFWFPLAFYYDFNPISSSSRRSVEWIKDTEKIDHDRPFDYRFDRTANDLPNAVSASKKGLVRAGMGWEKERVWWDFVLTWYLTVLLG